MGSYKRTSCRLCNSKYLKKVLPLNPIPTSEQYSNDKNISIKDIPRKTIQYINKGNLTPGIYTELIDLSNLAKGIYLYELCLNNKTSNGKIILTK